MKYNITLLFLLLLAACTPKAEEAQISSFTLDGETIIVNDSSIIAPKLKVETIQETPYQQSLLATGTVKAIPNYYAEIAVPFSGRVTKVYLTLGMKTKPGTPLFEMASPEFTEVQKTLLQAKSEWHSAKINLKRQQDLHEHGVAAKRDVQEAQTNLELKQQEYENAAANLKIYGLNPQQFSLGQSLVVRSPIAGEVISNEIVLGHYIKEVDEAHAKIAQLNTVWVVGEVKEKDLALIQNLDRAEITLSAYPDKNIIGRLYHIDEIVDEETRSVKVMMECDNQDHTLKPGMYVRVRFVERASDALFVPAKAVLQYNDQSFVFVEVAKGKYQRRIVETSISEDDQIRITKGLKNQERIITEGAFYLLDAK